MACHSSQNLEKCYFGPFGVRHRIGDISYKFILPSESRIHLVLHIYLLRPYRGLKSPFLEREVTTRASSIFANDLTLLTTKTAQHSHKRQLTRSPIHVPRYGSHASSSTHPQLTHKKFDLHVSGSLAFGKFPITTPCILLIPTPNLEDKVRSDGTRSDSELAHPRRICSARPKREAHTYA
ncbi:hypothetical protein CR513_12492, partial [Mucuna pruriens]